MREALGRTVAEWPTPDGLSYEAAVPRGNVHRTAVSEVFLTDAGRLSANSFVVAAQWPRRHYYFDVDDGHLDPLLVAETLRQTTILVAHLFYGVPEGHSFLMNRMSVELYTCAQADIDRPVSVEVRVVVDKIRARASSLVESRTRVDFLVDGELIARGQGDLQVVDPRVYARLRPERNLAVQMQSQLMRRTRSQTRRARAVSLLRTMPADESTASEWTLSIDCAHPVFFDHPTDHVPGLLIAEAVRQAARAETGWFDGDLMAFDGSFSRFLELGEPVLLRLRAYRTTGPDSASLTFLVEQNGEAAVEIEARLERPNRLRATSRETNPVSERPRAPSFRGDLA